VRRQTRALAESEAQLRRKNAELKRLNEMKAEFISIAAHELRTPLTSIVGYLDLIHEGRFGAPPEAMERPMASLHRNAHRLRRLVDEMLDVSRIEQGQVRLYRVPCDLGRIVVMVIDELEVIAREKGVTLEPSIDAPPPIDADVDKMRQAVSKLVASAIRYAPEGGVITVGADAAPQDQFAGSWTRLRVRHTGGGIPRHLHSRIFEPFFDMQSARHHTSSGPDSAGLGLYISRGLIDLHGGLITVDSEEGTFTEFTVLLPRATRETR
jgi:signal transduction histidine kinase